MGSLEEIEAAFTEPSPAVSSLGSWADECERADTALAAAEAQMGKGCTDANTEGVTAIAEAQLDEEDWEWLAALEAATAPLRPRPAEAVDQLPGKKEKPVHGPPSVRGPQRSPAAVMGKGVVAPKAGGLATKGAPARRKHHRPSGPRGQEEDEIQVLKVQKGGLTLPARVKERQNDRDDQRRDAVPLLAGEGRMVVKKLTEGAHGVRKIIEFRNQRGKGHAAVDV